MRGKGTDSARVEKKTSKQTQLIYDRESKTIIKIENGVRTANISILNADSPGKNRFYETSPRS